MVRDDAFMLAAFRPRAFARVVLAILAFALLPVRAWAAPLEDYRDRVWQAIDIAEVVSDGDTTIPLSHVSELLPPRETVELGSQTIEVDNTWLSDAVSGYESTSITTEKSEIVGRIVTRLYAMNTSIAALGEAPEHATQADRDRLQKILSGEEFRAPREDPLAAYLRELRRKVFDYLRQLLDKLFGGQQSSTYASGLRIVTVAIGAVALILLVRAVAQAVARRGSGRSRRKKKVILGEEVDEATTSADLAAAARALAAGGDFRGAIRKLFVALIYELDERGAVTLRSEATNREYLALVRSLGALYPVMSTMTDVFERVWYGGESVERADYDSFEAMHSKARAAVPASAAD